MRLLDWIQIIVLLGYAAFFTVFLIFMLFQLYYMIHPYKICLLSTNMKTVAPELVKIINDEVADINNTSLVEIGAGKAVVSRHLSKQFSWKQVIGVEGDVMTYWLALIYIFLVRAKVKMARRDIYKFPMPVGPKVVYSYMTAPIIQRMYEEGRFNDCLVISLTFKLKGVEPRKRIPVDTFQKELLVYDFR